MARWKSISFFKFTTEKGEKYHGWRYGGNRMSMLTNVKNMSGWTNSGNEYEYEEINRKTNLFPYDSDVACSWPCEEIKVP